MSQLKSYRKLTDRIWPKSNKLRRSDRQVLRKIRSRASKLEQLNTDSFSECAQGLRERMVTGLSPLSSEAVVESFALTVEALRRETGKVYYDVQLLAGLVLSTGCIAEMQTGEGKTITCGLPAVLYGMSGHGVHVSTTNAYLAERDHEELAPIFKQLGLSSGMISSDQDIKEKRLAYECDITYGTGYEFGFDFLRDQLAIRNRPQIALGTRFLSKLRGLPLSETQLMQRSLSFAIVDEADSVLIDEAATPLILSGANGAITPCQDLYHQAMVVADSLVEDLDFKIDPIKKSTELTDDGWMRIHENLPKHIQNKLQRPWSQYIEQSLRAKLIMLRDVDYVVQNNEVVIVDQNTGRLHDERKWRSGQHQSVEMRAGVPLTAEREIEARITRQRYFRFYDQITGMTGTATGNEMEMMEFYSLPIVEVPRNKPSKRNLLPSRFFKDTESKNIAIVEDIKRRVQSGQPILVGTKTITQSRELSELLDIAGVSHTVLNGTQDEAEAAIISRAGHSSVVTIATSMAGRGTDIRLDPKASDAGGLHVLVAEHHESPRVDRQLIGRCARQSDPGSSQFFVCCDDEIIQRYDLPLAKSMKRSANKTGECRRSFAKELGNLQVRIEKINFASRRKMVVHDRWMESVQESVAKFA